MTKTVHLYVLVQLRMHIFYTYPTRQFIIVLVATQSISHSPPLKVVRIIHLDISTKTITY